MKATLVFLLLAAMQWADAGNLLDAMGYGVMDRNGSAVLTSKDGFLWRCGNQGACRPCPGSGSGGGSPTIQRIIDHDPWPYPHTYPHPHLQIDPHPYPHPHPEIYPHPYPHTYPHPYPETYPHPHPEIYPQPYPGGSLVHIYGPSPSGIIVRIHEYISGYQTLPSPDQSSGFDTGYSCGACC
ncbi:hypothetical protein HNY73_009768 [Argiope bruennichi]|uniref:Uncharacterized protein n=1 Tax=Argiope bruennichi TaxID=94029 RepID=A0A8T0FDA8_ARGBR|nr:hypothetical protein HNY73_009768 [Argiope bruennichi]